MTEEQPWFQDNEVTDIIDKIESGQALTLSEIKTAIRLLHELPMDIGCSVLQQYLLGLIDRLKDE